VPCVSCQRMSNVPSVHEIVAFLRSPAIAGIEVMEAEHTSRNWTIYNTNYALAVPVTWCGEARLGSRAEVITPGMAFCTEPGQLHSTPRVYAAGCFHVFKFESSAFRSHLQERGFHSDPHWREPAHRLSPRLAARLHALLLSLREPSSAMQLQTRAAQVIDAAIPELLQGQLRAADSDRGRAKAEMIRECLMDAEGPTLDLDAIALHAGLNRFQVLRTFTRYYGVPPHAYQIHHRIARAKVLLEAGHSPSTVALKLGFADQSHMTRLFRRIWGVAPGRYAKATAERRS
jgi:AraC-like DNA-binding protein